MKNETCVEQRNNTLKNLPSYARMVRHSLTYVPYTDKKAVAADLKKVYSAYTTELAAEYLDEFELTWGDKYPAIVTSWRGNLAGC